MFLSSLSSQTLKFYLFYEICFIKTKLIKKHYREKNFEVKKKMHVQQNGKFKTKKGTFSENLPYYMLI